MAPENTLAAARKALDLGADMWELDVSMTADGELIVVHDETLERTSNVKEVFSSRRPWYVRDFTLKEIRRLDFGSWFAQEDPFGQIAVGEVHPAEAQSFAGEPAPTLEEALRFTKEYDWLVNIEIKDLKRTVGHKIIAERVTALVEQFGMVDRVLISSFNQSYLRRVRAANLQANTGVLVHMRRRNPQLVLRRVGAVAYHPRKSAIDLGDIAGLRKEGFEVLVWVVNDKDAMRDLINGQVSGIFTDYPQLLQRVLIDY